MEATNTSVGPDVNSGASNPLPLQMQVQQMSNWDWAAVSSSVNDYYFGGNDRDNTQDKLVGKAFGGLCATNPRAQQCDRPNTIRAGLILTGRYNANIEGALPLTTIQSEIDAGHPIVAAIGSTRGGWSHVLVIIGYDQSANIIIKSPAIGDQARVLPLAGFPGNLFTDYQWHSSCTTRS
jgi:hypothetical protein